MKLIDQHTKRIMEGCKERARDHGLVFDEESLEYVVTNADMIDLQPKVMIPTMYDFWVHDIQVFQGRERYKISPHNPYETVINSKPPISFYNDNNPDWLNVMIFYHVLAHIDFFQNNQLFAHTWNDDVVGKALANKRQIQSLRSEHGRWVDYVLEFARSIDNLVGYFPLLNQDVSEEQENHMDSYYFNVFCQNILQLTDHEIFQQVDQYNSLSENNPQVGKVLFFNEVIKRHPEFEAEYKKYTQKKSFKKLDVVEFVRDHAPFLQKEENKWMKTIINIVRDNAIYFSPQIRTKIINEGWASYWHDRLFRSDNRIAGHEVQYAKINASVTSISKVGLNPYAIGLRLIQEVEELGNKGKLSYAFDRLTNIQEMSKYDKAENKGLEAIFHLRKHFSDFTLINRFVNQDFVNKHDLVVVGSRHNEQRNSTEYYVKSKRSKDYKKMLLDSLYHPPSIVVEEDKTSDECLCLRHEFEGKQLLKSHIKSTMMGLAFLWGAKVELRTTEFLQSGTEDSKKEQQVLYCFENKELKKEVVS
jgi:stage V sporulation protein R